MIWMRTCSFSLRITIFCRFTCIISLASPFFDTFIASSFDFVPGFCDDARVPNVTLRRVFTSIRTRSPYNSQMLEKQKQATNTFTDGSISKPGGSIADRMKALQNSGLSISTSKSNKRLSKDAAVDCPHDSSFQPTLMFTNGDLNEEQLKTVVQGLWMCGMDANTKCAENARKLFKMCPSLINPLNATESVWLVDASIDADTEGKEEKHGRYAANSQGKYFVVHRLYNST
ncbi:hypothetical protein BT96DRAFT_986904 [Gymnopus androsaceus JB14]|uniref:Uncharacterized protein n=1 Tax=Gymnopus androsaceus JB14 TaxID=1447944 RepID=A0A6A4I8M2_9AGAR|nr:hypothetical protein BT96DRAFT_986904 [Gymnopus androsaceus JB14]